MPKACGLDMYGSRHSTPRIAPIRRRRVARSGAVTRIQRNSRCCLRRVSRAPPVHTHRQVLIRIRPQIRAAETIIVPWSRLALQRHHQVRPPISWSTHHAPLNAGPLHRHPLSALENKRPLLTARVDDGASVLYTGLGGGFLAGSNRS